MKVMSVSVQLMGGLGNQLFQIATGYALAKKYNIPFFISDRFGGRGQGSSPSKYEDTLYRHFRFAPVAGARRIVESQFAYSPISLTNATASHSMLDGYFQSELYFPDLRKELRSLFLPSYADLQALVFKQMPELVSMPEDACFLGVRRGDYLRHPTIHNPCGMDYYTKAMSTCVASRYYILSDDLAWCRAHFVGPQYVFLDIEDDLLAFYVGTLFSKYIIGNSTYHWWMSYLSFSEAPTVVAPDKWVHSDKPASVHQTIYRSDMIVLERTIEVD
jgi:hypothetical protein